MCIFVHPVKQVSNTSILVVPLGNGKQLVVYQNTAKTVGENVMFLPFPQGDCYPVNTATFPALMEECERFFEKHHEGGFGGVRAMSFGAASKEAPLPVQRVGGYRVSVAPTLADLSRLSSEVFKVPVNIQQILEKNYGQGFGFLVCLFSTTVQAHPIAYVTNRLPGTGHLFIPTLHAHGEPDSGTVGATTPDGQAIHRAYCDGCQVSPIVGARWQCTVCADFDYCDTCYATKRKQHGGGHHPFLHMVDADPIKPQPPAFSTRASSPHHGGGFVTWGFEPTFPLGERGGGVRRRASGAPDDWDHHIYIANGALNVPRFKYDDSETQNIEFLGTGFSDRLKRMLDPQLAAIMPELKYLTKVSIVGQGYGNFDYQAVEYQ